MAVTSYANSQAPASTIVDWPGGSAVVDAAGLLEREWLVTNGLGGYASSTLSGVSTRRYHGLLVAALPAPLGRVVVLNQLTQRVLLADGTSVTLSSEERVGQSPEEIGSCCIESFFLDMGLPVWRYRIGRALLEKRVVLIHGQNTVLVQYKLLEAVSNEGPLRIELRPLLNVRPHEFPIREQIDGRYALTIVDDWYEVSLSDPAMPGPLPTLRMRLQADGAELTLDRGVITDVFYRLEASRGYESRGALWSPGHFEAALNPEDTAVLVASTEEWDKLLALPPEVAFAAEIERRKRLIRASGIPSIDDVGQQLVLAADQFVIEPAGRVRDAAIAHASGDEVRTVIAGYHWFTDWGRDTMISLEGLTLTTGRTREAGYILRTFAHYVQDGLIPNFFPDGTTDGLYHTADATLWFFHALDRYLTVTGDRETLTLILPTLRQIVLEHLKGTRFGIRVDPADGLLCQGQDGYQLTWMDAKVDDWVVTPRRGKAVEINALWYNALRLLEGWLREDGDNVAADDIGARADQACDSFNRRFWYGEGGYLYDVVDSPGIGDDPSCRPNQIFSISPRYPVLDRSRWQAVLDIVDQRLLTPVGLRSLVPTHPDFKSRYDGDLQARDAAYHQGTVWAWLIGPYIDAWQKCRPDLPPSAGRRFLEGVVEHLGDGCVGSISEIFDAEPKYLPRGCIAQAWSVAEALRCWVKTGVER